MSDHYKTNYNRQPQEMAILAGLKDRTLAEKAIGEGYSLTQLIQTANGFTYRWEGSGRGYFVTLAVRRPS